MLPDDRHFLDIEGVSIAVRHQPGREPGLVWLGGFRSDMSGTKAEALRAWAAAEGRAFLRHDYSGHGQSGGDFRDGTISRWLRESLAVMERFAPGRQILVASSMGAWIALRMVRELRLAGERDRVAGLVLLAPAPDFTADLVAPKMTARQKQDLLRQGYFAVESAYSPEATIYTRALIEDGEANSVLTGPIDTHCLVHVIQGLADPDVPHAHALKLISLLPADDVTLSLVPGGDHRLSRPEDLALLVRAVSEMVRRIG